MLSSFLIDFFHLFATTVWIGGMFYMETVFYPSLAVIDPDQAGKLQGTIAKRFTVVAWSCIIILLITGLLKTPSTLLLDSSSTMGVILLTKHLLILLIITVGLLITFFIAPRLRLNLPKAGERPGAEFLKYSKILKNLAATNMFMGIAVLVLAVLLG